MKKLPEELKKALLANDDETFLANLMDSQLITPDSRFELGRTLLHFAAKDGATKVMKALLSAGANKDAQDEDGNTPLMLAAIKGTKNTVELLLEQGANPNLVQRGGRTALVFAKANGFEDIAALLTNAGSLDKMGNDGVSAETARRVSETMNAELARSTPKNLDGQAAALFSSLETLAKTAGEGVRRTAKRAIDAATEKVGASPSGGGSDDWAKRLEEAVKMAGSETSGADVQDKKKEKARPSSEVESSANVSSDEEALKKLESLGFENMTKSFESDPYIGWEEQSSTIAEMLKKGQNVMIVGGAGTGKTSLAMQLAGQLSSEGKILMQVPSSLIRGNKYAGSVNENIQKWLPTVLDLYPKVVLYFDKAHVLSTGKTSSDETDTPMQILKEFLKESGERRVQVLGSASEKEFDALSEDEGFVRRFARFELSGVSEEKALEMLSSKETQARLAKEGYDMSSPADFERVAKISADLLDTYIFNQPFPKKAFEFIKALLTQAPPQKLSEDEIEKHFSKHYSIPLEIIRGEIEEDSPFLSLDEHLNSKLMGQKEVFSKLSGAVLGGIMMRDSSSRAPTSFIMMGATGVGKTESSETMSKHLDLPILTFNMGEFKTLKSVEDMLGMLSDFITKNYSGIMLFDEIEKASPQVWDILLSLVDKGVIGSGKNTVKCGNHIIIATTNVGAHEMAVLKKELDSEFQTTSIDEDWLRGRLVEEGMRIELVSRFTRMLDFNPITHSVALKIGRSMFDSKAKQIKEDKDVEIIFDDSFVEKQILSEFDERFGARGVRRTVNAAFEKILSRKDIVLKMRKGTRIVISESGENLIFEVTTANGEQSSITSADFGGEEKKKLALIIEKMKSQVQTMQNVVDEVSRPKQGKAHAGKPSI